MADSEAERRGFKYRPDLVPDDYPIAEVFGYAPDADTDEAKDARDRCWCPFRDAPCTKLLSAAKTGICSVRYKAEGFHESIWAICANRLAGAPFQHVMDLHFGAGSDAELVPEVRITNPTMSFDAVCVRTADGDEVEVVGIEAQTIDTRGGSLQPLWRSYVEGEPDTWRDRYPARPTFGVNTTNVWKRLLPQVMNKGRLFQDWESGPLYVVLQDAVFQFITRRMSLQQLTKQERDKADIVWIRWDYTGERDEETGQLVTELAEPVYTTLQQVETAFVSINAAQRPVFVAAVLAKKKRDTAKLAALKKKLEAEAAAAQAALFEGESGPESLP